MDGGAKMLKLSLEKQPRCAWHVSRGVERSGGKQQARRGSSVLGIS